MKNSIWFLFKYILFWIGIDFFFRLVFLLIYSHQAEDVSFSTGILSFFYGFKQDLLLTIYILVIPVLAVSVFPIVRSDFIKKTIIIYSGIILVFLVILNITNLVMYEFWKYPIDKSILDYVGSPREWFANTNTLQVLILAVIFSSLWFLFWYIIFRKVLAHHIKVLKPVWSCLVLLIVPLLLFIVPLRGRAEIDPSRSSSVFFRETQLLNHAAVNPAWNVVCSLADRNHLEEKFTFIPEADAMTLLDSLNTGHGKVYPVLNTSSPNIVLILMESFASTVITHSINNQEITPVFNQLIKEGLYFSNFYSTGAMTDRALAGIISGYPALPGDCIIQHEKKIQTLPFISNDLRKAGYSSTFLYGGDINFAGMKSYFNTGGFDRIISDNENTFSPAILRSRWGVPDEFVFLKLYDECSQATSPFFMFCLTLSNHNPFDVPMEPVFPGNNFQDQFFNSTHYSDKCLGEFISKAMSAEWYSNTLFIILGDHGSRIGNESEFDLDAFKIPMLWLGGALQISQMNIDLYGSQTDIPGTILRQLNLPAGQYQFSKNLLDQSTPSFAFYSCQNGFGMINDQMHVVYNIPASGFSKGTGNEVSDWQRKCQAYMQCLSSDFMKR